MSLKIIYLLFELFNGSTIDPCFKQHIRVMEELYSNPTLLLVRMNPHFSHSHLFTLVSHSQICKCIPYLDIN